MSARACEPCLRRTALIEQIGGHLDFHSRELLEILELDDEDLLALPTGALRERVAERHAAFGRRDAERLRERATHARLELVCRCDAGYPWRLRSLQAAPAVIHVAGGMERFLELCEADPVAIVGSRRATEYGIEVAKLLGRGISASGVTVVSGMAPGVDSGAHEGALAAGGRTIAVLAGCASRAYPRRNARLHARILERGVAISETGPGSVVRRWMLPARNRIIAALSELTVVVQARERSGVETTLQAAHAHGRLVGAVPGSVLLAQSQRPNQLLAEGALLIRGAQDALDALYGAGARAVPDVRRVALDARQQRVLEAISSGTDTIAALSRSGLAGDQLLTVLAGLELTGCVRRAAGGRYAVVA